MSGPCLHCRVWEAIMAHSPKDQTGAPHYDAQEIMSQLGEVMAEVIASHPDRNERRRLSKELPAAIRDRAKALRVEGKTIRSYLASKH